MRGLQNSHTWYFNSQHPKSGHLFEGRYKAFVCQKNAYLLATKDFAKSMRADGWFILYAAGMPLSVK
jgi:uncharacterized protein YchJ